MSNTIQILYRISDIGYKKIKPEYINNENCLKNFCRVFANHNTNIIADNISDETYSMIQKYVSPTHIHRVSVGHGAGTFNIAFDTAVSNFKNEDIVYFVENDYLHLPNADQILLEGISLGFTYVSLYDHPDKYIDPSMGGNKYSTNGAENTRVYMSKSCHWKLTNSTTMTFATKVGVLKKNEAIFKKWTSSHHPHDFEMFCELLGTNQEFLGTPIPGYSTHGETQWLSPLIDWSKV